MKIDELALRLTTLARFKAPFLAVTIKRKGDWYSAQLVAEHRGKVLAQFGNRLARTLPELKDRFCQYLFDFRSTPAKQQWIESEIARLESEVVG
jgi:hypothetical protein